jgi:hypothetical protein
MYESENQTLQQNEALESRTRKGLAESHTSDLFQGFIVLEVNMKRSEEILRIIRINDQAIDIHLKCAEENWKQIKENRRTIEALSTELREIADGTKPDFEIVL